MATMKLTPAYWKQFLSEVLAKVKHLILTTFFMTLFCADLRWNEFIEIITKLQGDTISALDINNLNYFDQTNILNKY